MGRLEKIVGNGGKGLLSGLAVAVDPIGYVISSADRVLSGVGLCDKNALPVAYNEIYQKIYKEPDKNIDSFNDYASRLVGNVLGVGAGVGAIVAASAVSPILGLAVPAIAGLYSLIKGGGKWIYGLVKGEEVNNNSDNGDGRKRAKGITIRTDGKKSHETASFTNGFNYGYHLNTHWGMDIFHELESDLTGRGYRTSHIKSSINDSARNVRRNFASVAGSAIGGLWGLFCSVATLGILPLYKSFRDMSRNFDEVSEEK